MAKIMAEKHILKLSTTECVIKCYMTESAGGQIRIDLETDLKLDDETFDANNAVVTIQEIYWGAKKDKQIDISRTAPPEANTVHGHYYLLGAGAYDFVGFVDDVYADGDIVIDGDGPFHVILKLRKVSGYNSA